MKKLFLLLFLITWFESYSQDPILSISKTYFRTHPFDSKFSTFIINLQRDPWLTINEFYRRTDTTFFFLSGTYKNFNPLHFSPTELKIIVAEEEIIYSDSLQTLDTIMNLQLHVVIDSNTTSARLAEKEFKKFHQAQSRRFDDYIHKALGAPQSITGELYNYFISPFTVSPVTIAWGIMPGTKQYTFAITIRFKVVENQAAFITQPGELKGM